MSTIRRRTSGIAAIALVASILTAHGTAQGADAATTNDRDTPLLLTGTGPARAGGSAQAGTPDDAADLLRWQVAEVDHDLLQRGRTLSFNLFDDVALTGQVDSVDRTARATTWTGHLDDGLGSFVAARSGDVYEYSIVTPEGTYSITPYGDSYRVAEADTAALDTTEPDVLVPPAGGQRTPAKVPAVTRPGTMPAPAQGVKAGVDAGVVDVAILYTAGALADAGGPDGMNARMALMVATTNAALANSGVAATFRLVGAQQTATPETPDTQEVDLEALTAPGDGRFDEAQALRETVHADLVQLFVSGTPSSGSCGIAWLHRDARDEIYGYSVVENQCNSLDPHVSAHEWGHNLGLQHNADASQAPVGGAPYAVGYVNLAARWRTVMAYDNTCAAAGFACPRIAYYSNPNVTYGGVPTGTAAPLTNNAQRAAETTPVIAGYRQSQIYAAVPTISGKPRIKKTLTASAGAWAPGGLTFGYQWYGDGAPIPGATSTTLKLGKKRVGQVISVGVTGSGGTYAPVSAGSAPIGPVLKKSFKKTSRPRLLGKAKVGRVLTVKVKAWKPKPKRYKYVWYRNGKKIKGQKDRTYRLKKKDKGKKVWVKVVARKKGYQTTDRTTRKVKVKKR